jgi:transposase
MLVSTSTHCRHAVTAGDGFGPRHAVTVWGSAFAALRGSNPVPASSGKTQRHRLNRGVAEGVTVRPTPRFIVSSSFGFAGMPPTQAYMQRRLAEGKTKPEIMRCLKRYVAR